jgi:hypothetical protein
MVFSSSGRESDRALLEKKFEIELDLPAGLCDSMTIGWLQSQTDNLRDLTRLIPDSSGDGMSGKIVVSNVH